jgi:hypothetical protein
LVVQALVAGVSASSGATASWAVIDTYGVLKGSLVRRLAGRRKALKQLEEFTAEPGTGEPELITELTMAGAVDLHVLEMANRLLALIDPAGMRSGSYQVHL